MESLTRCRKVIAETGVDAILISTPTNSFWLSGFTGSSSLCVVTADKAHFITDGRYAIQARDEVKHMEITVFATPKTRVQVLAETLTNLNVTSVGYESGSVTVDALAGWKKDIPNVTWQACGEAIDALRMIKAQAEIDRIRAACELTDAAFDHIIRLVQPGVSEFEIQLELEFFVRRHYASMAFNPIIVSGINSARPHGHATEKKLEVGEFVTMDFGAKLDGYCADLTRTVVVRKADERTREIYDLVLEAQMACLEMMRPGIVGGSVDQKARDVMATKDMAKYFGHGLGHGLGIEVHDTGSIGAGSKIVLEPGQVWTVEPGIYVEGFGGCRIEDDVVVTQTGIDILNKSPKHLMEIG
jgi:Xaa-Pro aminopeptidase